MDDSSDEDDLNSALDRISDSEEIEDQVDREILRYWNNRVAIEKGSKHAIVKRFRFHIYKTLHRPTLKNSDLNCQDKQFSRIDENEDAKWNS